MGVLIVSGVLQTFYVRVKPRWATERVTILHLSLTNWELPKLNGWFLTKNALNIIHDFKGYPYFETHLTIMNHYPTMKSPNLWHYWWTCSIFDTFKMVMSHNHSLSIFVIKLSFSHQLTMGQPWLTMPELVGYDLRGGFNAEDFRGPRDGWFQRGMCGSHESCH